MHALMKVTGLVEFASRNLKSSLSKQPVLKKNTHSCAEAFSLWIAVNLIHNVLLFRRGVSRQQQREHKNQTK